MSNPAAQLALLSVLGVPLLGGVAVAQEAAPAEQSAQAAPTPAGEAGPPGAAPKAAAAALAETPLPLLPLPLAPEVKGPRPRVNPKLVTPAATELAPAVNDLPDA